MEINGMRSADLLSSIYAAAYASPMQGNGINSKSGGSTENLEISATGILMNAISQMSGDDRASVQSFLEELKSSVQDGTFDAETMTANAPDALISYADESGMDLTTLIRQMADGIENNGGVYGPPPPRPPMMSVMNSLDPSSLEGLSDDEKSSIQSFIADLTLSIEDGTFDAETMAANAPDALASLAEENGLDLAQMLEEMAEGIENSASALPPPPPPPLMNGTNGYSDFFNQFFSEDNSEDTSSVEAV